MKCVVSFLAAAVFAAVVQAQNDICSSGLPVAAEVCGGGEIPGIAGVDYPTYSQVPSTNFRCDSIGVPGYYADPEAACQAFYICGRQGKGTGFLCPNGTLFNQEFLVCDWWNHVDCAQAVNFYSVNQQIVAEMEAANERLGVNQRERERLAGIAAYNPNFNPNLPNQVNPFVNPYNRFNSTLPFNQNRFPNSYNPASPFNPVFNPANPGYNPISPFNPAAPYNPNFPYNQNNPFNPYNRFNATTPYPYNPALPYNPVLPYSPALPYNPNLPYSPTGPYNLNPYRPTGPYNPYNRFNATAFNPSNPFYNPLANIPGQYPYDPRYPDPKNPLAYRNPLSYPGQYPYDPRYPDPKNPLAPKYPGYPGQYDKNPLGYPGQYPYDPRYPNNYPGQFPYDPTRPDLKNPLAPRYPNNFPGQYPYDPRYPDPKNPLAPKYPGFPGQYPYDPRYPDPKNPFVTPRPLGYPTPNPFVNPFSSTIAPPLFGQPGYSTPRPFSPSPTLRPSTINIGGVGTTQRPFGVTPEISNPSTPQPTRPGNGYNYPRPDREYLPPL